MNYAAGPGNPIQIMDFSFAVQLCAVDYLLRNRGRLSSGMYRLPGEEDRRIATLALEARGANPLPYETPAVLVPDWRRTRFADTVVSPDGSTHD